MIKVDAVFDIETESWDKFVIGGIYHADGVYEEFRWENEDSMVQALLRRGGHVWTWNGGLFDSLWLVNKLRALGLRVVCQMAGTRVIRVTCEGLNIHDGLALVPMSLAKAALIAGIDLIKDTGLKCRCGKKCGGYCSIRRTMLPSEFDKIRMYLRRDCEATLKVLLAVIAEAARCDYVLGMTVGGTAYKNAARICDIESAEWLHLANYRFARRAYYGGRVEVFQPQANHAFAYDINSAYPAALTRVPLPVGDFIRIRGERAVRAWRAERPGLYLARVKVPRVMHVPPLPIRTPGERVVFPTGSFTSVWALPELLRAQELGVDIQVDRALVWTDSELVLAPFMLHGWSYRERAEAEGNKSLAQWHKWILNSCTGKFAESPEKERVVINPKDDEVRICWCARGKRKCYCSSWKPLDKEGEVWTAPFFRLSDNAHVHWAAYLTSATRVELLDQLIADGVGGRTAVYCDTDSVYASTERDHNIGPALGWWKYEGRVQRWLALAPKVYRYELNGETVVRGKGLPGLDAVGFELFARGEPVEVDRGVMGLRSAARSKDGPVNLFRRKGFSRRNHADGRYYGGRVLGKHGLTHPRDFMEIIKWEKRS